MPGLKSHRRVLELVKLPGNFVFIFPVAVVAGPACLLIVVEPDMGTMLVVSFAVVALLIAAGLPLHCVALREPMRVPLLLINVGG